MARSTRTQDQHQPTKVDIRSPKKRLFDGFFKIDELTVSHERFDGTMSPVRPWLIFERGDAVAALLFDKDRREVILVNQFRAPTFEKGSGQGWLLETAAGMIKEGETPERCLVREIREETGYQITEMIKIAQFYSSPGGSSERIFLYYAEVRRTDKVDQGGGVTADDEDIALVPLDLDTFLRKLANREFEDPKIIVAGMWLKDRSAKLRTERSDNDSETVQFELTSRAGKYIGYKTGNILATKDVDVWVNNENTDMMMDRFFGRSVSAAIRYGGARKFDNSEKVLEDTIAEALRAKMNGRNFVKPTTVIDTTSGELNKTHNVRRIFHVASVEGQIGQGLKPSLETLELCIDEVLKSIDASSGWLKGKAVPFRSVLIPLLGTGEGGFAVKEVALRLVHRAIAYLEDNKRSKISRIYFVAYSLGDREELQNIMQESSKLSPALREDRADA